MTYRAVFEWSDETDQAEIIARELYSHAEIFIDGELAGKMAYRPYRVRVGCLKAGRHQIAIRVYNTEANSVAGTLELERERYHGRFAHLAHYDRRRLKSGLLAPVLICPIQS